jgi:hypothetical protein
MMTQQTPQQVIEGQRQDWNRVAGGWEKWDQFFDEQMAFLNHRLVADARLRAGMRVLDLGSVWPQGPSATLVSWSIQESRSCPWDTIDG